MSDATFQTLKLTLFVAGVATTLVILPGGLLAYLLARHDFRGKTLISAAILLPLVMPPTALGYLLLSLLAYDGPLGRGTLGFDLDILLTWRGAVLASAIMAAPLVVRTARVSFEGVDPRLEAMARTLGHGRTSTFVRFTLPLASKGLIAAGILGFARALGEFGATITVAGNIPGRTQTLAAAIVSAQQAGHDSEAWFFLAVSIVIGFSATVVAEKLASKLSGPKQAS